jgi:hypothetical protein
MLRITILIFTLSLLFLGCQQQPVMPAKAAPLNNDSRQEMIDYLRKKNLPVLDNVEIWENEYGPGLKLTTTHYEIFTTLLEPLVLSQVPGFMESAYRGYQDQLPKPIESPSRFRVYLFAQRKQWDDFTTAFAGQQAPMYHKIKSGAYYLNGSCVAYNIGRDKTFSVLGHEGWHQFNSRHFRYRLPSWLDEGVAMLFETSEYDRGFFYFKPERNGGRLGSLKKTLMNGDIIRLKDLISMNPGEVVWTQENEKVFAFYAQAYALVRFLREEDYGRRLSNYHALMMGSLRGDWPVSDEVGKIAANRNVQLTVPWNRYVGAELFKIYIDEDFDKIEKEYLNFCRKIVYHVRLK